MCCDRWVPECVCVSECECVWTVRCVPVPRVSAPGQHVQRVVGEGREGCLWNTYHAAPHTCHTHTRMCTTLCVLCKGPACASVGGVWGLHVSVRSSGPCTGASGHPFRPVHAVSRPEALGLGAPSSWLGSPLLASLPVAQPSPGPEPCPLPRGLTPTRD